MSRLSDPCVCRACVDHRLPPDPFFDKSNCPIWDCDIDDTHTHAENDPRLPLNRQRRGDDRG